MIEAIVYSNSDKGYVGFSISGHAGYAKSGKDIVCASVTTLAFNFVNSVEQFTDSTFKLDKGDSGLLKFNFLNKDNKGELLFESLVLGLTGISKDYGNYLKLYIKEV